MDSYVPMMMMVPTHCRQGSLEGLFRTASRWGLGADFQQRGPRWDRVGPDDQTSQESLKSFSEFDLFQLQVEACLLHE